MGVLACAHDEPAKTASNPDPSTPPAPMTTAASTQVAPTSAPIEQSPSMAPASAANSAQTATDPPAALLTNEQILLVARTADEGEIEQARLAQSKSRSERVRSLAAMMLRDHKASEKKGDAIAVKDNLALQASPTSESLQTDADGFTRTLKAEAGPGFDKDYVQTQVREHEAVLDVIDHKLIPSASNPDVKTYLEGMRSAVASHLEHARNAEQEMNKQTQN
jgi:putative membrane protein